MATNSRPTTLTLKLVVPWYASLYLEVVIFGIFVLWHTLGPLGLLDDWNPNFDRPAARFASMVKVRLVK